MFVGVVNLVFSFSGISDLMPELPGLLAELHDVAAKWYNIGLYLVPPITNGTLDTIKANCCGECGDCLREMLSCWLKEVHHCKKF